MAAMVRSGGSGNYDLGQNSEINVTPFVDIMLVLLIVMMVAAPVATLATKIDLPPAAPHAGEAPTFISIRSGGSFAIVSADRGIQATGLSRLATDLAASLGPHAADQPVLVRADRDVKYETFMSVVNQLQSDGYYKVSLITEARPGEIS